MTWFRVADNNWVYPLRCTGNPICQSMWGRDKRSLLLIRSPESHLIICINDIVVFFHFFSNRKEDRPCHTVPPYSRYFDSDTFVQLYKRDSCCTRKTFSNKTFFCDIQAFVFVTTQKNSFW